METAVHPSKLASPNKACRLLLPLAVLSAASALGCQPAAETSPTSFHSVAEQFPAAADLLFGEGVPSWTTVSQGHRLVLGGPSHRPSGSPFRSQARALEVTVPARPDEPVLLRPADGPSIELRRRDADHGACARDGQAVICTGGPDGVDALWLPVGRALEELVLVREPVETLAYDLELPSGWYLAEVAGVPNLAQVHDAQGAAQLRVSVPAAWDANGAPVAVSMTVDAFGMALSVDEAAAYPVLIDPSWVDASVPLRIRVKHTATLLGDGRVLIAGGITPDDTIDATAEIYEPRTGTSTAIGVMTEARSIHSATLLRDGRVLVAGGVGMSGVLGTTEIFDPATATFAPGPVLAEPRRNHAATRLSDGTVLLAGGGTTSAELFDPTTDAITSTEPMNGTMVPGPAAALLADGRVLLVGSDAITAAYAEIFDPEANGGAGGFETTGAPTSFFPALHSLTLLRDGRVLVVGGCPCVLSDSHIESSTKAELYDPDTGVFSPTNDAVRDRVNHSATLLPSGKVLIAGAIDEAPSPKQSTAELFDPDADGGAGEFGELAEAMSTPHGAHTATLLPTGEVLIFGGDQASAELYVGDVGDEDGPGGFAATDDMGAGRYLHSATVLADGRALLAGGLGGTGGLQALASAELFDPNGGGGGSFSTTDSMAEARAAHTATLLADGRVLLAGGQSLTQPTASAELFDPSGGGGVGSFSAAASMAHARLLHTATTLPDGRILVTGGTGITGPLASAEIYDPATDAFSATSGGLTMPRSGHGAALLPSGKVLLVGAASAELYHPTEDSFTVTANPGTAYVLPSITVLPSGKALVMGSSTLAAELYDPDTESFSYAGNDAMPRGLHQTVLLPSGAALIMGGQGYGTEPDVYDDAALFEPLSGRFVPTTSMTSPRTMAAAAALPSGAVLITGGLDEISLPPPVQPLLSAEQWSPSVGDPAWRPVLSSVPAAATPGEAITIEGAGFGGPESSSGRGNASASNHPVVTWRPRAATGPLVLEALSWTADAVTARVPPTVARGPGWLTVAVNGIASEAAALAIAAAPLGVGCRYDAQCDSGHCVDGVCCDEACDELCEACLGELKGSGDDGTCGPVPPELDPDDDCELSRGAPCTADVQCTTAHCADGVCCESPCPGQCEACDVEDSVGLCVPVIGAPHGDRPQCDAVPPEDLCETALCDGQERTQCNAKVGPCIPYACTATGCLSECTGDEHCAVGHHCDEGTCVAGQCDGTLATTAEGQVVDCSPYLCRPDGTCPNSCADVSDCAEPFACNFDGRCVARPPRDEFSAGCGCRLASEERGRPWGAALLATLVLCAWCRSGRRRARLGRRWLIVPGLLAAFVLARPLAAQPQPPVDPAEPAPSQPDTPQGDDPDAAPAQPDAAEPASPEAAPTDPTEAADPKQAALEHFKRGIALGKEKAWSAALAEFLVSLELHPTRVATKNAALCFRKLGRFDEALDAYETLLRDYEGHSGAEKAAYAKQITVLRDRVGTIEIDAAEPGATILVDGHVRGKYPTRAPLRVAAGTHVVRVHQEGFEPFEQRVDVAGRQNVRLEARLAPLEASGTLKVRELSGKELEVLVDNVVVGRSPWQGKLSLGQHVVRLRGPDDLGTTPVPAPVRANETTSLQLRAERLDAELRVAPTPASAKLAIDSVEVGRGVWEGRLPSGSHRVEIAEEGFVPVSKKVELAPHGRQDLVVELERDDDADIWQLPSKWTIELNGAVALAPSLFGDVAQSCTGDCSQGLGAGVLAFLHAGYELGSGLGFGVAAGYLDVSQDVEGRPTTIQPVGLSARSGTASDALRMRGLAVGATGSYRLGEDYPVQLRLGAGPLFATVEDRRVGSFTLDGMSYQAGPLMQDPSATYLFVNPEARLSVAIGEHVHVGAGLQVLVLVALSKPQWDPSREVDAATDGIGAFGGENLTGPVLVFIAPGVGARAHF